MFRIWNPKYKEFNDDVWMYQSGTLDHDTFLHSELATFTVSRNTFFKDESGRDIFEGDIIQHGCVTQEYESVIAYKSPSFIAKTFFYRRNSMANNGDWVILWDKAGIDSFNNGLYMGDRSFEADNYVRIIGNIFENPELLEK
jgi:uncharacterized phage protein (TIGR01671 family)